MFLTSPISEEDKKLLPKLANRLKKENVSVSILLFGEVECNQETISQFIEKVNKQNTSRLLVVQPGLNLMSFVNRLTGDSDNGGSGNNDFAEYGGIDPSVDPELALIMQQSLQEAKENGIVPPSAAGVGAGGAALSEDEEIRRAMELSLAEAAGTTTTGNSGNNDGNLPNFDDVDPELREALRLSLLDAQNESNNNATQQQVPPPSSSEPTTANVQPPSSGSASTEIHSEEFLKSLLDDIPGVDTDEVIKQLKEEKEDEEKKKKDDKK